MEAPHDGVKGGGENNKPPNWLRCVFDEKRTHIDDILVSRLVHNRRHDWCGVYTQRKSDILRRKSANHFTVRGRRRPADILDSCLRTLFGAPRLHLRVTTILRRIFAVF